MTELAEVFQRVRHPITFDIHSYLIDMVVIIDDIVWVKLWCVRNRNGGFFQYMKSLLETK